MVERNAGHGERTVSVGSGAGAIPCREAPVERWRRGQPELRYEAAGDSGESASSGRFWTCGGTTRPTGVLPGADGPAGRRGAARHIAGFKKKWRLVLP